MGQVLLNLKFLQIPHVFRVSRSSPFCHPPKGLMMLTPYLHGGGRAQTESLKENRLRGEPPPYHSSLRSGGTTSLQIFSTASSTMRLRKGASILLGLQIVAGIGLPATKEVALVQNLPSLKLLRNCLFPLISPRRYSQQPGFHFITIRHRIQTFRPSLAKRTQLHAFH